MIYLTDNRKLVNEFINTLLSGGEMYNVLLIYVLMSQLYLPVLEKKKLLILLSIMLPW